MKKYSKKYVEASKKCDKKVEYSLEEAIKLVKETSITKFDGSVDFAMKLNVDPKKADQQLRGSLVLPNGTGKTKRILVLAKGASAEEVEDIQKGMVEFRTDQYGNIHGIIGKTSFEDAKLKENMEYVVSTISKLKPATVKGKFVQSISLSATMGPGVRVDKNSFDI